MLTDHPVEIRYVGPHAGQKKLRDLLYRPDAVVVLAILGRRWGKSVAGIEICNEAASINPGLNIGWFTDSPERVRLAWQEFHRNIRWPDGRFCPRVDPCLIARARETDHLIEWRNGSLLTLHSCQKEDPGVGSGFDLVIGDEAARIPGRTWDESIFPTMIDRGGRALLLTTPKGKTGRGAWVWRDFQKAKAGARGYYMLTGPTWENPLPTIQEWVGFCKDNLPQSIYEQEIEAQFLDAGAGVLDLRPVCTLGGDARTPIRLPWQDTLAAPHDREAKDGGLRPEPCIMGLDLAQRADWSVAWVLGADSGRTRALDRFSRMAWEAQAVRIAEMAWAWRSSIYADATGLGGPVVEILGKALWSCPTALKVRKDHPEIMPPAVVPITITSDMKQTLVQGLQVAVERKEISLPYVAEAVAEADTFESEILSSGRMRYAAAEGCTDDLIMALSLAVYGKARVIRGPIR